jgi:hypothetical protein
MKKLYFSMAMKSGGLRYLPAALLLLMLTRAHADSPQKIDLPSDPGEPVPHDQAPASSTIDLSTTSDLTVEAHTVKEWKLYQNPSVGFSTHVKSAWTVTEFHDSQDSASASFAIAREPVPGVNFSVQRDPLDRPFEEWVSSPSLTALYPTGYHRSSALWGGRKAVLIKGSVKDGRLDHSYFLQIGKYVCQVSFTAPEEAWKAFQPAFDTLQQNFRWLR